MAVLTATSQNGSVDLDIVNDSTPLGRIVISPAVILCELHQTNRRHLKFKQKKIHISHALVKGVKFDTILLAIFFCFS
jgi:hypothetical protein